MDNLIDQMTDRNEVDVEMAILALCMRKNKAVLEAVQNKLTEEDFTDERNGLIYSVILDMYYENTTIDRITVFAELEKRGFADTVGGQRYVYRVGDTLAVMTALDSYIAEVKDRSSRQKIVLAAEKIKYQAQSGKSSADNILESAITSLAQLRSPGESKNLVVLADVLKSTLTQVCEDIRDEKAGNRIKLGFPKLDAMLGGLGPGTLHVLAARPGMGKTALAVNMAVNVAANQNPVVIFSLEMANEEIGKRIMSSAMTKPISEIVNSRQLSEADRQQMDNALVKLRDYPIYFDDGPDINPYTMKAKVQQLVSAGIMPKLIFVDYLQLMSVKGMSGRSRNDEVANISRNLKLLAKEFRIPIIALSQLSRKTEDKGRKDHTPRLSDLRDSGAIEQDADTVMFVDRPDYHGDENGKTPDAPANAKPTDSNGSIVVEPAYIYLAKNRHGQVGKDQVWWIPSKTLFYEYNERDPQDPNNAFIRNAGVDVSGNAAAQKYEFEDEGVDAPEMDPPLAEDEVAVGVDDGEQESNGFFADANDGFPEGFV